MGRLTIHDDVRYRLNGETPAPWLAPSRRGRELAFTRVGFPVGAQHAAPVPSSQRGDHRGASREMYRQALVG